MGTLGDLKGCYSIHELKETGSTSSELKAAGATMNELKTGFDLMELKDAGFTVRDLKACWNMRDLKRAGYSAADRKLSATAVSGSPSLCHLKPKRKIHGPGAVLLICAVLFIATTIADHDLPHQ